ncbi:hypothetical protein NDU88_006548 [Pleurodeles waltl]|uniref:Uncharacterized protein n=1 Tax=Pleurodeles waltl TaxID=8319 RepID=A0AAV7WF40_PLEWA|nr:hypothetical protein NDU88_006548 [Pleurodeles waltl]
MLTIDAEVGRLKRNRLRGRYRGLRGLAEALLRCALRRGSARERTCWDPSGPPSGSGGGLAPSGSGPPGTEDVDGWHRPGARARGPLPLARAGWGGVTGCKGDDPWRGLAWDPVGPLRTELSVGDPAWGADIEDQESDRRSSKLRMDEACSLGRDAGRGPDPEVRRRRAPSQGCVPASLSGVRRPPLAGRSDGEGRTNPITLILRAN